MGIPLLEGNAKDLAMVDAIFLSESAARKVFGQADKAGQAADARDGAGKWSEVINADDGDRDAGQR